MRFASLGSGSRGNATLVQGGDTTLLIDCGFPLKELNRRCELLGVDPACIDALLVTHEHGDHSRGVGPVARRHQLPVWMTHGTWRATDYGRIDTLSLFDSHTPAFELGDIQVQPLAVPHDAREPTQFVFRHAGVALGLLTDLGSCPPFLTDNYQALDGLLLECNHDTQMLADGPYPPTLQARVGGNYGHLNNQQAAQFLGSVDHPGLQCVVAAHLSEKNNHPDLAVAALCESVSDLQPRLSVLQQDQTSAWFNLN